VYPAVERASLRTGAAGIAPRQDGDHYLNPIDFARTFRSWRGIEQTWSPIVIPRGERP
jgi:hypothetical protein